MKLGIDFGTTRIVVAVVDRGNYPIASFEAPDGSYDWFPPLIAVRGAERLYGWDAWAAQAYPGWTVVRSVKRFLADAGPQTRIEIARRTYGLLDLLIEMMARLKQALFEKSSLRAPADPCEVMLGVPANANSNQRFLTVECFRRAGFSVLGLLNEPSAASIEYGHRQHPSKQRDRILVYDLGGGTFDASLVELDDRTHSVIASEGIPTLGGDDFDQILAELALDTAGISDADGESLSADELFRLHEECRRQKESLNPNSRKTIIDLDAVREGWGEATVSIADFYERCRPLMDETVHAVEDLLVAQGVGDPSALEALYVTGGGSELPLVARVLREQFGRRVRRSAYTRSATAIGLAVQADSDSGYVLREMFNRNFGVWREAEGGSKMILDVLFPRGTRLPAPGDPPLESIRCYQPVHNIGHFRYLEARHVRDGQPSGDVAVWDEIFFPFDPVLRDVADLSRRPVEHTTSSGHEIEERFACDSTGTVTVAISNLTAGYHREYRLGRWSAKEATVKPTRKRRIT